MRAMFITGTAVVLLRRSIPRKKYCRDSISQRFDTPEIRYPMQRFDTPEIRNLVHLCTSLGYYTAIVTTQYSTNYLIIYRNYLLLFVGFVHFVSILLFQLC